MKRLVLTIKTDYDLQTLIEYCEAENISLRESDKTCGTFLIEAKKKKNGLLKVLSVEKIDDYVEKKKDLESFMTKMLKEWASACPESSYTFPESSYTFGKADGALAYYEIKGGNEWS